MELSLTKSLSSKYNLGAVTARPSSKLSSEAVYSSNNVATMHDNTSSFYKTEGPDSQVPSGFVNSTSNTNLSLPSKVLPSIFFV